MLKQRFIFAVSLFAILAVGNVWADTASGDAVKTVHDVYEDLDTDETGIAGVSYVNKMVNAAGAAAQDAENHAASAGASALSAAAAASAAQTAADNAQTTADKVSNKFDNTSTVKNAIVTTDANGKVAPVAISDTGTGTYVTGVTVSGGTVTLSRGTPTAYSLPTASASTKGGVKIGANVNVATDGTISVPTANGTSLGLVKQGTNITIGTDGTISAKDTTYSTGTATASGLTKLYTTTGTATDGTMTQAALNTALSGKQAKIENLAEIESGAAAGATAVQPSAISDMQTKTNMKNAITDGMDKENTYPTVALLEAQIDSSAQETGQAISDINAALSGKQATLTGDNVTSDGNGNVVTAVTAANGVVTVTKGTIATADIADGAVTTAKIKDANVTTAKIADAAVTVAKTSGVYGYIPTKNSTGTVSGTAEIWVE